MEKLICRIILVGWLSLCTSCFTSQIPTMTPKVPKVQGPAIEAGSIPSGHGKPITLSNGAEIYLHSRAGVPYFVVQGTFSKESYSTLYSQIASRSEKERRAIISKEIEKIFSKIKVIHGVGLSQISEVGYFTFEIPYEQDLMSGLKSLKFPYSLVMSPLVFDTHSMKTLQDYSPVQEGFNWREGSSATQKNLSGLERMKAIEFVKQAESDIGGGIKVDGSLVNVGVADTGITLNHPVFQSRQTNSTRIVYLKDFTREGRVYFSKNGKFEIIVPPSESGDSQEDLILNAQVIMTPSLPNLPFGDVYTDVDNFHIKVSPQLRKILTTPGSGAKLGILSESAFQGEGEPVDINGNGKINDQIYMILIPGANPEDDLVYVDPSGTGDFRNSTPIGDWNKTKATVPVFSEQFGLHFSTDGLPSSLSEEQISVRSVSIVGYDPGNHGTHVSGIIAAKQMIENDSPGTLVRGVAPEAKLMVNRVCANQGGCNATEGFLDLAVKAHAEVINLSLGGLNPFNDGFGLEEILINRLTSVYNTLFVISAGNSGPGRQTVGSPSVARLALSVGASATRGMVQKQYQWPSNIERRLSRLQGINSDSDDEDFLLFFSSRGPTAAGGFKPNLVAPGTELSSVQLNSAPGNRGGLDIYWGTSMAAPAAAGAYVLFLDAIKKYNLRNPTNPLPTNSVLLKDILTHTARPFNVSRFEPETGEKLDGQYTWIDEGMGMIDLLAAWKKLFEYRDQHIPSSVKLGNEPVDLDYQVIVPMKSPQGNHYDGTKGSTSGEAIFGTGVYLDYYDTDTLRSVSIARKLPESLASSPEAGRLMAQLKTTQDEFIIKTFIYGSDRPWLKVGTLDSLDCSTSETGNLTLVGEGALVRVGADGTGQINPFSMSNLNLCINRQMIASELQPGDHGAILLAYRVSEGKTNPVPSFVVPVYLTVPHQKLMNSSAYQVEDAVNSFDVKRNYISIPEGTSVVKVTLEVPRLKVDSNSRMIPGQNCSGVEIMPLLGTNVETPFRTRKEARISNCDAQGRVQNDESHRKLTFTVNQPIAGIWDLPIFGSYRYPQSTFNLRVDYVSALLSEDEILGGLDVLNGKLNLFVKEASFQILPDVAKSSYFIDRLETTQTLGIKNNESIFIPHPNGSLSQGKPEIFRAYPSEVKKVSISTGDSPGNDIDLYLIECPLGVKQPNDVNCTQITKSDGPTDRERVSFEPKPNKIYAARVVGANIVREGKFTWTETLALDQEVGELEFEKGEDALFVVRYSMKNQQILTSRLLNHDLFKQLKYRVLGELLLKSKDSTLLGTVPISIMNR